MNDEKETDTPSEERADPIEPVTRQQDTTPQRIEWPKESLEAVRAMPDFTLRELIEASPDKISFKQQAAQRTEYFLSGLFAGADLLRLITDSHSHPRSDSLSALWSVAKKFPQMLPNPLPNRRGVPDQRKYIVVRPINPHQGNLDKNAKRIRHLAQLLPLRLVVFDGNNSLEAWFAANGVSDKEFFAAACQVGADPAAWHLTAPVRTPDALRASSTQQSYARSCEAGKGGNSE